MGIAIERLANQDQHTKIVARFDRANGFEGQSMGDVVIDVSHHTQTPRVISFALEHHLPLVIGTTALSLQTADLLREASAKIAICQASNFSVGAQVLAHLAKIGAKYLPEFDVQITETHHIHKLDSPSGTALSLQAALHEVGKESVEIRSIREGEAVGTHEVAFAGLEEQLVLVHEVSDRSVFAKGALLAARRIGRMPPGRYDLADLIGLTEADFQLK